MDKIVLCTSFKFQRGDLGLTPGLGQPGGVPPGNHDLRKVAVFRGFLEHLLKGLPWCLSSSNPTIVDNQWVY